LVSCLVVKLEVLIFLPPLAKPDFGRFLKDRTLITEPIRTTSLLVLCGQMIRLRFF